MAERDDVKTCGICSEPFKNGEVAIQAARWGNVVNPGYGPTFMKRKEKFWAHPVFFFPSLGKQRGLHLP
jgi:hypothetical protein